MALCEQHGCRLSCLIHYFFHSTALKRSFDMEDAEDASSFSPSSPPRSPLSPSPPGIILASGNVEGRRAGSPIQPTYQSCISLNSSPSPAHSPVLKTRISSSLSFNRGTMHLARANGTNLTRVSSFQTRLNPNGVSSSLGPGSDNESPHSSSSSLECPTPLKGPQNTVRQAESPAARPSQLSSSLLKKFSSHGSVFHAEVDRSSIRQVSKATVNHSSLPSLDLHIAEDQGTGPTLCPTISTAPPARPSTDNQNCLFPPPKSSTFLRKENAVPPSEVGQLVPMNPAPPSRQMSKLQKFPISLDGLIEKTPVAVFPTPVADPVPKPLPRTQLQVHLGASPNFSWQPPEISKAESTVVTCDASMAPSPTRLPGVVGSWVPPLPPPQAASFQLMSQPQAMQVTSQTFCLGGPPTGVPPPGTSALASPRESPGAATGRFNSISCQENKHQNALPTSCLREEPLPGTKRPPEIRETNKSQGSDLWKEGRWNCKAKSKAHVRMLKRLRD